jgi:hypothetical protein
MRKWYPCVQSSGTFRQDCVDAWHAHGAATLARVRACGRALVLCTHALGDSALGDSALGDRLGESALSTADRAEADRAAAYFNAYVLPRAFRAFVTPFPCSLCVAEWPMPSTSTPPSRRRALSASI